MILVCEMGDKTFFIAAIMAMRHDRLVIFAGAISALAVMTVCVCVCVCVLCACARARTSHCMFFLFANSLWNMCLTTCQCVSGLVFHDWICSSECSSQSVHTLRRRCLVHIFRVRIKSKVTLQMHILRQLCSVFRCAVSLFVSGRICHHAVTRQCDDLAL